MAASVLETLEPVETVAEIRANLFEFNRKARSYPHRATKCLRQSRYWVFEQNSGQFAPSKFVGYKNMTFPRYEQAIAENIEMGRRHFMPPLAAENFSPDMDLSDRLRKWSESLLGPRAFGKAEKEWSFFALRSGFVVWR